MPTLAILDSATRVVKGLTSEPYTPTATEAVIEVPHGTSLSTPIKVLVDGTIQAATAQEVRAAGLDEEFNASARRARLETLKTRIQELIDDGTLPSKVRVFAQALKALYNG